MDSGPKNDLRSMKAIKDIRLCYGLNRAPAQQAVAAVPLDRGDFAIQKQQKHDPDL
jgi:hypothetical protein